MIQDARETSVPGRAAEQGWLKQRYEIKYLLRHRDLAALRQRITQYMMPDRHGRGGGGSYFNHSIYFDNPHYHMYREKHEGLLERTKPRLRAYRAGPNSPASTLFLEMKNRHDRIIHKDRVAVSRPLAERLLRPSSLDYAGEVAGSETLSKFYYLARRFGLEPQVAVLYNREAYLSELYPNLRITFDTRLQGSRAISLESSPRAFRYVLAPNRCVLEIKYNGAIPKIVLRDIEAFGLQQATYSKFASSMECNAEAGGNVLRNYFD